MRSRKIRTVSYLLIGTAIAAFGSVQAAAQGGVPEPATTTPPATTSAETDIVVTAQRREERLVNVPMSVTAVNSTALAKAAVTTFSDIDQVVVGVKIGNTGIFPQPSVRGVTSFLTAGGADSNVAVYVDGSYQADPLLFAQDIVNLQSIEVLKGPQGSLYGRNASGGAILIRTLDPDMNKFTGKFSAGYGNYNDARGSGYVSIPLAPGLAMSFTGSFRRNDGYIRGITVGKHNNKYYNAAPYKASQFNPKVKWAVNDDLTLSASYRYTYLSDPLANSYNIYKQKLPILVNQVQTDRRDHIIRNVQTLFKSRSDTVQVKAEWKTDIGTLVWQTQWQRTSSDTYQDDDDTAFDYTRNGARFGKKGFDHNLQFQTSGIERLDLVVGINYFNDKSTGGGLSYRGTAAQCTPVGLAAPCVLGSKSWMKTRALAPYIDGTYNIADGLFLTAGLRYTRERKIVTSFSYKGADLFGLGLQFPLAPFPSAANFGGNIFKKTFTALTPRFVLRYEIANGANVYASFSKGFKSGTFNTSVSPLSTVNPPVKPEKATNYEIGFKMSRPRLRVEAAVFYTKYKNLQTSAVVLGSNGSLTTAVLNAKGMENYGGEINVAWTPVDDLNIHGAVGYTHARYLSFKNASVNLLDRRFCAPLIPTCNTEAGDADDVSNNPNYLVANTTNVTQDFSGLQPERSPDWTANVGVDYTAHIGGGNLVLSSNLSYVSSYAPRTAAYDPITKKQLYRQKGYAIVNAQGTYNFAGDHFSVGVWVKNLTGKRFLSTAVDGTNGTYNLYSWPRTFGFNVGYKF
jgi:iron complex outermembrane receptor protein